MQTHTTFVHVFIYVLSDDSFSLSDHDFLLYENYASCPFQFMNIHIHAKKKKNNDQSTLSWDGNNHACCTFMRHYYRITPFITAMFFIQMEQMWSYLLLKELMQLWRRLEMTQQWLLPAWEVLPQLWVKHLRLPRKRYCFNFTRIRTCKDHFSYV